MNDIETLKVK